MGHAPFSAAVPQLVVDMETAVLRDPVFAMKVLKQQNSVDSKQQNLLFLINKILLLQTNKSC